MPPAMARPKGGVNIERATHIDKDGWYINGANVAAVFHSGTGEIRMSGKDIDRLAAYEDTGLEPEDFKRAFNKAAVLKLAGQALGITPDRLRELAQADKEGRCVVLPCKIGDTVYHIAKCRDFQRFWMGLFTIAMEDTEQQPDIIVRVNWLIIAHLMMILSIAMQIKISQTFLSIQLKVSILMITSSIYD